jgi:cytochrome c
VKLLTACGGLAVAVATAAQPIQRPAYSGEMLYRQACYSCHALEPGRDTPAGPTLHNILGRRIAARPDFNYSPALRRLAARRGRWTRELIDAFVADPETVAPGTEMSFIGMSDVQRRVLIAWLADPNRRN